MFGIKTHENYSSKMHFQGTPLGVLRSWKLFTLFGRQVSLWHVSRSTFKLLPPACFPKIWCWGFACHVINVNISQKVGTSQHVGHLRDWICYIVSRVNLKNKKNIYIYIFIYMLLLPISYSWRFHWRHLSSEFVGAVFVIWHTNRPIRHQL